MITDDNTVIGSIELFNDQLITYGEDVKSLLMSNTMLSFNGNKYDVPVISAFYKGANNKMLKSITNDIIQNRLMPWTFERKYDCKLLKFDHIDLIEVAPDRHSLKFYMARLRAKKLQELPIPPDTVITPELRDILYPYCFNDNHGNFLLYNSLRFAIKIRKKLSNELGQDVRSKSDPQIGDLSIRLASEKLLGQKLKKVNLKTMKRDFRYHPTKWLLFKTQEAQDVFNLILEQTFHIKEDTNKVLLPPAINKQFAIKDRKYKLGIGGLHSVGDTGAWYSNDEHTVIQIDVSSYYPNTIINGEFFPPQIPKQVFFTVYKGLYDQSVDAQRRIKVLNKRIEEIKGLLNEN